MKQYKSWKIYKILQKAFNLSDVQIPLGKLPIERRKFSISISVFLTSDENTSDPTIGQNGILSPNSCAIANAIAVYKHKHRLI